VAIIFALRCSNGWHTYYADSVGTRQAPAGRAATSLGAGDRAIARSTARIDESTPLVMSAARSKAKNAEALRRISLARFKSRISRSSCLSRRAQYSSVTLP